MFGTGSYGRNDQGDATADAAVLCLKASNAVILRGGSEALRSNQAIAAGLPHWMI